MRKNIVFFTLSLRVSGGNRVLIELANHLAKDNRVEIICPANRANNPSFTISPQVKVILPGINKGGVFWSVCNIAYAVLIVAFLKRTSIVIVSDPILTVVPFFFRRKNTIRFVQSDDFNIYNDLHVLKTNLILKMYKFLTRISFSFKVKYIFNSRFSYDAFFLVSGRKDVPYEAVLPGVDLEIFKPVSLKVIKDTVSIGLIARTHPMKGLHDFIDAWYNSSSAVKEKVSYVNFISPENVTFYKGDKVRYSKPLNDQSLALLLRGCDIFVFTSWWEGFGLPPLEAMASGCMVIMPAIQGVMEYGIDGTNCIMYKPRDINDLANSIAIAVNDHKKRASIALEGLKTAQQFSWGKSASSLQTIINKL